MYQTRRRRRRRRRQTTMISVSAALVRASKTGVCLQNVKAGHQAYGILYGGGRWCAALFGLHRSVGETWAAAATARRLVIRTGINRQRSGPKLYNVNWLPTHFKFQFYTNTFRFYSDHGIIDLLELLFSVCRS